MDLHGRKVVAYLRVSTNRQGRDGYGIEAQRQAICQFLHARQVSQPVVEFIEVESGIKTNRPKLTEALVRCETLKAILIIAKIDRLARNVFFVSKLMDSGVEFIAVDFPQANRLTIHILAAVAEYEREMVSKRTKDALSAAKKMGTKLGSPKNLAQKAAQVGRIIGNRVRKDRANEFAKRIYPLIKDYIKNGYSEYRVAKILNSTGVVTYSGKENSWSTASVKNVISRYEANFT